MEPSTNPPRSFFDINSYAIKAFIIVVLVLVLLIPTTMVDSIIRERNNRQEEVTEQISHSWGKEQQVTGPVIAIPYLGDTTKTQYAYILPENLRINGEIIPEKLRRGIFSVAVYNAKLQLSGNFSSDAFNSLSVSPSALNWQKAVLLIELTDLNGIGNQVVLNWNDKKLQFNPNSLPEGPFSSSIQAPFPMSPGDTAALNGNFNFDLKFRGSQSVKFSPIGKTTKVALNSSWTNPSFDEAFPPATRRVDENGFAATWEAQHLNRSFPQAWVGDKFNIHASDFGVKLFLPTEVYQMSTRAIKYAILIIGLTFLIFYFLELSQRLALHPLQYTLIGLALCIFYTLLISISEQINFMLAYLIASVLTIGLIVVYTAAALRSKRIGITIGVALALLYGFIFVVISADDQALLMGSLGLFLILAVVMYVSTKINWQQLGNKTNNKSIIH
ncbi:cell envelope integrity protein CreD [Chitinophaga silvatica]|uniref:Cell envelope integrity protein CreD n=1 Tax=Chitinophaga silvatica TaxID=2282649 RepID=A0A3E1Y9W3_9BACT|nr:cell envelope integrity protein CreD [Chitinophaga silvatica]RFS22490.1 cell envelope integrity protein CreD [Chitinophaga silvatica]